MKQVDVESLEIPIHINKNVKLRETPRVKTNIYRLKGTGINESYILKISKRFGLKGHRRLGEISSNQYTLTYAEGPYVISLDRRSGALRFIDKNRWQIDNGISKVDFSEKKAVDIAQHFITNTELVPADEYKFLKITRLHVGTFQRENKEYEERVIDYGVVFKRFIDKIPVEGPGGTIVVYIDHEEEVTGCDRIWREIKEIHRRISYKDLISLSDVYRQLEKYWSKRAVESIDVTDARFGYFEFGRGKIQRYLQPVYLMSLRLNSGEEGIGIKSRYIAQAAKKPVGRMMPRRKIEREGPIRELSR